MLLIWGSKVLDLCNGISTQGDDLYVYEVLVQLLVLKICAIQVTKFYKTSAYYLPVDLHSPKFRKGCKFELRVVFEKF